MTPRSIEGRCLHVGDVYLRQARPAGRVRLLGEVREMFGDLEFESRRALGDDPEDVFYSEPVDESIEAHRKERVRVEPVTAPGSDELEYEGTVLVHEP